MSFLEWLPQPEQWPRILEELRNAPEHEWPKVCALASTRLDFSRTNTFDQAMRTRFSVPAADLAVPRVKLAVLGSSTTAHLHAAIRVAGARRGMWIETYESAYGQYMQELLDPGSPLHDFKPDYILFAFDAAHITAEVNASTSGPFEADVEAAHGKFKDIWRLARQNLKCAVIQQTVMPLFPGVLGENEHRHSGSKAEFVRRINANLRQTADEEGIDLLSIDTHVAAAGLSAWHNRALWHAAKQEIAPNAAPMYGELVARVLAAKRGRSKKVLVLDLDNTLWGGVIGDDGIDGLSLGQGSAEGEAYLDFQRYVLDLAKRGVILAICSKNDPQNVIEAFENHPEILLKLSDFAAFVCNWEPKPQNVRHIAEFLNVGLDSLVFFDDNRFEREHVRSELPMVAVPEVGDEPADYARILASAGYFESTYVSEEDRARAAQYQANLSREVYRVATANIDDYLRGLEMKLVWSRIDASNFRRAVQLINKTNQFNLTARRRSEDELAAFLALPNNVGLQFKLVDRFGDNGIVAVVLGSTQSENCYLDTWLMSCRVLGRQVERATLNVVSEIALEAGASQLLGHYRPTAKNGMVNGHYENLGFSRLSTQASLATALSSKVLGLAGEAGSETASASPCSSKSSGEAFFALPIRGKAAPTFIDIEAEKAQ